MSLADIAINNEQGEEGNNPENIEKLELAREGFRTLVIDRHYHEAKKYWDNLEDQTQIYIKRTEKYSRWLKTLRMSSL